MTHMEQKTAAKKFVERWRQAEGNEQREANNFVQALRGNGASAYRQMTRGKAIYKKPRERLTDNEKACIDWLEHNGISPVVNAEDPAAPANIDLTIDGEPWEMKNVTNASSVSNQFNRIRAKWGKLDMAEPVRAVFSTENAKIPFPEIVAEVAKRVHPGERFIVLSDDGKMEKVEAEPCPDS